MPVKREAESPTPPSSRSDITNATTPPKRPRVKKDTSSPVCESKPSASPKRARSSPASSSMTPEIKEALVDHLMRVACSAVQKDQLAAEVSLTLVSHFIIVPGSKPWSGVADTDT